MLQLDGRHKIKDLRTLLSLSNNFDMKKFDRESRRPMRDLLRQVKENDMKAFLILPEPSSVATEQLRHLHMQLTSKKNLPRQTKHEISAIVENYLGHVLLVRMTVMYRVECGNLELREVARAYRRKSGTELVIEEKPYAGTETRMIGESVLQAARRAYQEEVGLRVRYRDIQLLSTVGDEFGKIHKSSVYFGFVSLQVYQAVKFELPRLRWPDGRSYKDGGVEIFQKWFEKKRR